MLVYNTQNASNPFDFGYKNEYTDNASLISSVTPNRATTPLEGSFSGSCRKPLSKKNIKFLQLLGFKVNKH